MDYKKDITERRMVSRESSSSVAMFGITLSKKCERLGTAIYLVTNFLSDTEPMKFRLRALSLDFVRYATQVKNGSYTIESNVLDSLRANIVETLALLELALIAGLVSEMNFTLLKREYVSLRDMVDVRKASRESYTDSILGENFFASTELVGGAHREGRREDQTLAPSTLKSNSFETTPRVTVGAQSPKGHSIGQSNSAMSDRNTKGHVVPVTTSGSKIDSSSKERSFGVRAVTDVAKESRRARILKLVKDNREVTIKDIATHFVDLSEKTIQRELVSLVENGVLKKFGERRWSRYALV